MPVTPGRLPPLKELMTLEAVVVVGCVVGWVKTIFSADLYDRKQVTPWDNLGDEHWLVGAVFYISLTVQIYRKFDWIKNML